MNTPAHGATFSADRVYRFRLWRTFGDGPTISFCMLNPSTADESTNDPTVERCQRRALAWGFGRLEVVNLFALRATDPAELYQHPRPIGGRDNTQSILAALVESDMMVAAWGTHGAFMGRGPEMFGLLRVSKKLHVLRMNRDGSPSHPLYLPYHLTPQRILP